MAHHPVTIRLGSDNVPLPDGDPAVKAVIGDTLRFSSPDGDLRINFVEPLGSFREVAVNVVHRLVEHGTFRYQCGLTVDGKEFGWPKDPRTTAGGEIIVERPRNT